MTAKYVAPAHHGIYDEIIMSTVTLTENFDLHVPEDIRDALKLKVGDQFRVMFDAGRIEFFPVQHPRELRGILRGIDTRIEDDEDRF